MGNGTAVAMELDGTHEDPGTARSRRVWTAGDFGRIATGFEQEAADFVGRVGITRGMRVLDAACGTGNLAIPAARRGAMVTGLDIAAPLLAQGRAWAARERLPIAFDEGSVEAYPYGDGAFDAVVSMFGVMFASRPELAVWELKRVVRPGGTVAMANWTREGFVGRMLSAHVRFVPPPAGAQSPLLWADAPVLAERFPASDWEVRTAKRILTFRYPHTPAGTAELFRAYYGPTVRTFDALDEDGRVRFSEELRALWEGAQVAGSNGTVVEAEYLEVVATRH